MLIPAHGTVVFQGDSITDAERDHTQPDDLGKGYALMAAAWLAARYSSAQMHFVNRGIGGNRVADLAVRWQRDCLDLRPDVVSILIGINDVWRRFDANDPTSPMAFEAAYRDILTQTHRIGAHLIIGEPFVLPTPPDRMLWRADLDTKRAIVRDLAQEFGAVFLPLDSLFAAETAHSDAAYWASDGVHPTAAGHMLIAQEWLRAVGEAASLE